MSRKTGLLNGRLKLFCKRLHPPRIDQRVDGEPGGEVPQLSPLIDRSFEAVSAHETSLLAVRRLANKHPQFEGFVGSRNGS